MDVEEGSGYAQQQVKENVAEEETEAPTRHGRV
jgi:hypothetical protein